MRTVQVEDEVEPIGQLVAGEGFVDKLRGDHGGPQFGERVV
jgi:hypothetical protein